MTPLDVVELLIGLERGGAPRERLEALLERLRDARQRAELGYGDVRALLRLAEQLHRLGALTYRLLLRPALARLRGTPEGPRAALIEALQDALFEHPLATQKIVAALVAEGREYAKTEEGAALKARLERSAWIDEAAAVLEIGLPGELEANCERLPHAYLDLLFQALRPEEAVR